jgi:hypothetical protein
LKQNGTRKTDEYINDTFCPDTFGSKSIVNLIALTVRNLMKINNLIFTIKKVSNLMNFKLYILKANVFSKDEDIKKSAQNWPIYYVFPLYFDVFIHAATRSLSIPSGAVSTRSLRHSEDSFGIKNKNKIVCLLYLTTLRTLTAY